MRCLLLAFTTAFITVVGCGPLKVRNAIPTHAIETARVSGFENVRYWGDRIDQGLQQSFITSWDQERAASTQPVGRIMPDSHYLAISGGGQNGAFGAGVLYGWTQAGNRPTFKVVTGISTGALIAPFAFLGSMHDDELKSVYTSVNMEDIAVFRGLVDMVRGDSAYNTDPLARLVDKHFTTELIDEVAVEHRKGRRLFVGTTHLDAQRPIIWDMGAIACIDHPDRDKLFRKILLASSAIPGAFAPVYLDVVTPDGKEYDELHVDGGVTREMFLMPSELRLFELREKAGVERMTHLYVIRNSKLEPEYDNVSPKIAPIAERSVATLIKAQAMGDIIQLYDEAQVDKMSFQLASIPFDIKDDSDSMFDSKYMKKLFDRGFESAKSGYTWQRSPHDWRRGTSQPVETPRAVSAKQVTPAQANKEGRMTLHLLSPGDSKPPA